MAKKPVTKTSDAGVFCDAQRHTCIVLKRDDLAVSYIPMDILGFEVRTMAPDAFDSEWKLMEDYPVEKAAKLYAGYATDLGGTPEAMQELAKLTNLSAKEIEMATAKQSAKPTKAAESKAKPAAKTVAAKETAAKGKPAAVARQAKPVNKDGTKIEKKPSAAQMFKDLIKEGKLTDEQIFAKVQKAFNLDDSKRGYVKWYRNDMIKKGEKVPAAK